MSAKNPNLAWVEIVDPQTGRPFYANTVTGECLWDRPANVQIQPRDPSGEWWELYDAKHDLPYYYHTKTQKTEWVRPENAVVISLIALQRGTVASSESTQQESNRSTAASAPDAATLEVSSGGSSPATSRVPSTKVPPAQNHPSNAAAVPRETPTNAVGNSTLRRSMIVQSNAGASSVPASPKRASMYSGPTSPVESVGQKSLPGNLQNDIRQFAIAGFAQQFFATHKKGIIFKRKVPLEKMLLWTKDSINQPLMLLSKDMQRDALKSFKIIQKVMNEKGSASKTDNEDIQKVLQLGVLYGEIRDEIYCQLCKQLTENPFIESVYKGWEMMCAVVITFPPSKNFESYLRRFMEKHSKNQDEKVQTFAKHCLVKLGRIGIKGPRGKVPTIAEIDRAKESPFFPSVFGESLADIMASQREKYPNLKVPLILKFLAEGIIRLNGCSTEGIFRVPGDSDAVTDLRIRIEKNQYDLSGFVDASVPASLLKLWLRDLSEPLIPADSYDYCIQNSENPERALAILQRIPSDNAEVLSYLIKFLQIVSDPANQKMTKMSINNISMVFAPNILRCPGENLQLVLENTRFEQSFVRTLIQNLRADHIQII